MKKEPSLALRRTSISVFFFIHGFCFSTWASRIPNIQQHLHLNEAGLGAVLFALPIGSFVTVPFSGWLAAKYGSKILVWITALIYACLLSCIGWSSTAWQIVVSLFLFGSAGNMCNIAFNTQAIALEKMYGRKIMSSFHGIWSVAGLIGAGIGAMMMGMGVLTEYHFLIITTIALILVFICRPLLLEERGQQQQRRALFSRPEGIIVVLGFIAFCSMMCQGAMFDWTGVYFKKVLNAGAGWIGAGYTGFMLSMAAFRFLADWITQQIGLKKVLIWSGLFTGCGLLLMIIFPNLVIGIIGSVIVGIGVSAVVPLVFSAVAQSKAMPTPVAIAAVSTVGFVGLLIGPPMVGFIAASLGLKTSFLILAIIGFMVSILSLNVKYDIADVSESIDSPLADLMPE